MFTSQKWISFGTHLVDELAKLCDSECLFWYLNRFDLIRKPFAIPVLPKRERERKQQPKLTQFDQKDWLFQTISWESSVLIQNDLSHANNFFDLKFLITKWDDFLILGKPLMSFDCKSRRLSSRRSNRIIWPKSHIVVNQSTKRATERMNSFFRKFRA